MSLRTKMDSLELKGRFAIWKRTSSPKGNRVIRKDIKSYLSEHTKPGVDKESLKAGNHPNWLKNGVDYLTKEEQGKLKVYGFLREDVFRQTGRIPHRMENDELIHACLNAWVARKQCKDIKRAAHKYVLSLNPELCEVMAETGHCADELLTQSVRRVLKRYQEKYYPGEKLGYLLGIHHDKAHLHAHVMLFPTTESGKLLLVTDYSKKNKINGHKRPFTDMRIFAEQEIARYYKHEIQAPFRASERNPAKYAQPKLISLIAYMRSKEEMDKANLSPEQRRLWALEENDRLTMKDNQELREALTEGYKLTGYLFDSLEKSYRTKEKTHFLTRKQLVEEEKKLLSDDLKQAFREIKELKEESRKVSRTRRDLYNDLSNWRHYRFNYDSVTEGGNNTRDCEVYDWLKGRIAESSELGTQIQNWIKEKESRDKHLKLPKDILRLTASEHDPVGALRFTEKDQYVRKCLGYGSKKLGSPMIRMMEQSVKGCEFLSRRGQRDFVREFLNNAIRLHRDKQNEILQRREELNRRVKSLRLQQRSNKLKQDIFKSVENGRRPDFLEEYQHWKNLGMKIPTDALKPMRSGLRSQRDDLLEGERKMSERKSGDYLLRLHQTIQDLRSIRMKTGSIIMKGGKAAYYRNGIDPPARLSKTRIEVIDHTLNRPAVERFIKSEKQESTLSDEEKEKVIEERRREVRARRMEQEDTGLLDR